MGYQAAHPPGVLHAAHWCASRYGLDAGILDVEARCIIQAREIVKSLLGFTRPALEDAGDWEEVSRSCVTL